MTISARRTTIASLFAIAFVVPLAWLLSVRVPATSQRQLVEESPDYQPLPVELPRTAYQQVRGVSYVHQARLKTRDVGQIANRSEVRLLVATHNTRPSLERGELAIVGTDCIYQTVRGAEFPNNAHLTFRRGSGCFPLRGTPTGEIRVTLRFTAPGRVALWTFTPPPDAQIGGDAILIADPALLQSPARPLVRGVVVDTYPANSARRIDLLAYMWQVSPSSHWLWFTLGLSGLLVWSAAFCFAAQEAQAGSRGWNRVASAAAGAFCAAAALSVTYAVVVPPFQAADEPNHFVSFAALVGRPDLETASARWGELSHFERIQFHPDERFGPWDRERPGVRWDDGVVQDIQRGAGIAWLWRPASFLVRGLPAPHSLLTLRLTNALLFALTVACYVFVVGWIIQTRWPELWAVPLFLVPTLPFFASYVSNYSLLVDAYVMLAAGVIVASCDVPRSSVAGPLIAASWVFAALVSRSALPLAPMIAALVLARLLMGTRQQSIWSTAIFWGGVGVVIAAGLAVADSMYTQRISDVASRQLPPALAAAVRAVFRHPLLALLPVAAAGSAEWFIVEPSRQAAHPIADRIRRPAVFVTAAAALGMAIFLAASFVLDLPRLYPVDPAHPPPIAGYIRAAEFAGLTMFRFGRPDLLMSVTFWGGFGWLDTLLPDVLVAALAGATGLAFVTLLVWAARIASIRAMIFLCLLVAGYVVSLAAYAGSVILTTPADLHGRYLIGLYLLMVTVAWSSLPRIIEAGWIEHRTAAAGAGIVCVGVHVYSLSVILQRYF